MTIARYSSPVSRRSMNWISPGEGMSSLSLLVSMNEVTMNAMLPATASPVKRMSRFIILTARNGSKSQFLI